MKILDKPTVNRLKAVEKQKEIDEGMKLAKSVDALRETKAKEEENLRKFRDKSLESIKSDIDTLLTQKNALQTQIDTLNKEKIKAEAPIDLTKAWKQVESDKKSIENTRRDLLDRETQISLKEIQLIDIDKRIEECKKKEKEAELHLTEARNNYNKTEEIRSLIEDNKKQAEKEILNRLNEVSTKEQDIVSREFIINQSKDEIKRKEKEFLEQGTKLIERESTVEAKTKELFEREEQIKEKEALTNRYNSEADKNYSISENLKLETQKFKDDSELEITNRFRELSEREREMSYKEHDFLLEKEKVENDKKDIEKEKLHIASQQETLRQAWLNIKRLQNK